MWNAKTRMEEDEIRELIANPDEVQDKMWFVVHEDFASRYSVSDTRTLYGPIFHDHPNHNSVVSEFLSVRLSIGNLCQHQEHVRLSSYRWRNPRAGGRQREEGDTFPENYVWFLHHLKETGLIGWVDFMSNACVGVDTSVTIGYMGALYAFLPVCGE